MKLRIVSNICCDDCNEVESTVFDCPECKEKRKQTFVQLDIDNSDYGEDTRDMQVGDTFTCTNCFSKFKLGQNMGNDDLMLPENWEWELVKKNEKD